MKNRAKLHYIGELELLARRDHFHNAFDLGWILGIAAVDGVMVISGVWGI